MDGHTPVRTWVPQIGLGVLLKGKGPGVEKGEVGGGDGKWIWEELEGRMESECDQYTLYEFS